MISPASTRFSSAASVPSSADDQASAISGGPPSPYDGRFWLTYLANGLAMMAFALLFRYADFVTVLGGTELHLGWIVGLGWVGSLLARTWLGATIDRYGARWVWLGALALLALMNVAHLAITSCHGVAIYEVRVGYCLALAGVFSGAATFIAGRVPAPRLAEMLGILGTSGFLGMLVGAQLGDALCTAPLARWQLDRLFIVAAGLCLVAMVFAAISTRQEPRPRLPSQPESSLRVVWRYQPGTLLVVGMVSGAALGLPATFLPTFAAALGIPRIALFFTVSGFVAVAVRVFARRMPEKLGLNRLILVGLGAMALSQVLFLTVRQEWQFLIPAVAFGVAHAILYPTVVAAGGLAFPRDHRGLATTFNVAAFDAGQVLSAPAAGLLLHFSADVGLPPYPTLFVAMGLIVAAAMGVYGLYRPQARPSISDSESPAPPQTGQGAAAETKPAQVRRPQRAAMRR